MMSNQSPAPLAAHSQNPSPFERNVHGHVVVSITGLNLSGAEEFARARTTSCRMSLHAQSCFTRISSKKKFKSYDEAHRLEAGRIYQIALVPGDVIPLVANRTTENYQQLATDFGYGTPLAGFIPRIHETISFEQRKMLGVWSIVCLHAPLGDIDLDPLVLRADLDLTGTWIGACYGEPTRVWKEENFYAFAFPMIE